MPSRLKSCDLDHHSFDSECLLTLPTKRLNYRQVCMRDELQLPLADGHPCPTLEIMSTPGSEYTVVKLPSTTY